jgi:glycosyltransferase involved in cell wall biosynthesis
MVLIFLNFKYRFSKTIIFASTPLTQGLLGVLSKIINPKTQLITYIQDLWPLIYEEKNLWEKIIRKTAGLISKFIFNSSDLVVSQSPFFEEVLVPYVKNKKLITIPNPLPDFIFFNRPSVTGVEKILEFTATGRVILFLGNVGRYQGLEHFVDIFLESKLLRLKLLILGDGSFYDKIEERIDRSGNFNIMIHRSVPRSLIPLIGSKSSFGLVCLKSNDAVSRTIPSKFQTYLACGLPVLSVGCRQLGDLLVNEGIGLASDWDPLSLINALQHLDGLNDQELALMSAAVVKHATDFTPEAISARFDAVFTLS